MAEIFAVITGWESLYNSICVFLVLCYKLYPVPFCIETRTHSLTPPA